MKIFGEIIQAEDNNNNPVPVFILYFDTEKTGNTLSDLTHCAMNITNLKMDSESITNLLIPMLSSLIEGAYGDNNKHPLTNWEDTEFDRNYPNGVKV